MDIRKLHTNVCNVFPKYYPFDRHACFWTVMYTNLNHKSNVSSFTYSPLTNQYHGEWNILGAFVVYSGPNSMFSTKLYNLYSDLSIFIWNYHKGINLRSYDALPDYLYPGMQVPQTRLDLIETFGLGRISNN